MYARVLLLAVVAVFFFGLQACCCSDVQEEQKAAETDRLQKAAETDRLQTAQKEAKRAAARKKLLKTVDNLEKRKQKEAAAQRCKVDSRGALNKAGVKKYRKTQKLAPKKRFGAQVSLASECGVSVDRLAKAYKKATK